MAKVLDSQAVPDSLSPSIMFHVELETREGSNAIISIEGSLKTVDNKFIAPLQEIYSEASTSQPSRLLARGSTYDRRNDQGKMVVTLISVLNYNCLEKIEKIRKLNVKHTVALKLELILRTLDSKTNLAHYFYLDPKQVIGKPLTVGIRNPTEGTIVVKGYDPDYQTNHSNGWILSGDSSPTFLEVSFQKVEVLWPINAVDWVQDYLPCFGMKKQTIVEMPLEGEMFQKTMTYINNAEKAYSNWDTKSVFVNCREIGKLLDTQIKDVFGSDSFTCKEKWGRAYSRFENWASLDLHIEDIKKRGNYINEETSVGGEDAENLLLTTKLLIKYAQELVANASKK
ncbi:MAG: hypothetical protein NTV61_08605 [Candidatus Bathyarchaeota archaeon]|nr:hypothetical protein [Candidatus Bathyarchaeota archaeon]